MRAPINLASEPFRKDRSVLAVSITGCIALTLTLGLLVSMIISGRQSAAHLRQEIERLNGQLRGIATQQAKLDATLRQPENAEVLERSVMLNALIERKGISWTRIFADLEKVMPPNVRLVNIRLPQINLENKVVLDMEVAAQTQDPVLDLLRKLQESPLFGTVAVASSRGPTQNEPVYRYRVNVNYAQTL